MPTHHTRTRRRRVPARPGINLDDCPGLRLRARIEDHMERHPWLTFRQAVERLLDGGLRLAERTEAFSPLPMDDVDAARAFDRLGAEGRAVR